MAARARRLGDITGGWVLAVRNKRLAAGSVAGAGEHDVYTVPAGTNTLLKQIHVRNTGGGASTVEVGGKPSGSASTIAFFDVYVPNSVPAGQSVGGNGWYALNPGDKVYVYLFGAGSFDYWLGGAELV